MDDNNIAKAKKVLEELVDVLEKHGIKPSTSIGIHDSETGNSIDLSLSAVVCSEDYG